MKNATGENKITVKDPDKGWTIDITNNELQEALDLGFIVVEKTPKPSNLYPSMYKDYAGGVHKVQPEQEEQFREEGFTKLTPEEATEYKPPEFKEPVPDLNQDPYVAKIAEIDKELDDIEDPNKIMYVDEDFVPIFVPKKDVKEAESLGFKRLPNDLGLKENYKNFLIKDKEDLIYSRPREQLMAGAAGLARMLSFGLSDAAIPVVQGTLEAIFGEGYEKGSEEAKKNLRKLKAYNPLASTAGEVAGVIAPAVLTGGASVTATGPGAARAAGNALENLIIKGGKGAGWKIAGKAAGSALGAAPYAAVEPISSVALNASPELAAESLIEDAGIGAIISGAAAAALSTAGGIAGPAVKVISESKIAKKALSKIVRTSLPTGIGLGVGFYTGSVIGGIGASAASGIVESLGSKLLKGKVTGILIDKIPGVVATLPGSDVVAGGATAAFNSFTTATKDAMIDQIEGENVHERWQKYIKMLVENPDILNERINGSLGPMENIMPETTDHIKNKIKNAVAFLHQKAVNTQIYDPFDPDKKRPMNPTEKRKFERYVGYTMNPKSIFDEIENGIVTTEAVETLRVVYPSMYNQLATEIALYVENNKIDWQTKAKFSKILQYTDDNIVNLQNIHMTESMPGGVAGDVPNKSKSKKPTNKSIERMVGSEQTDQQRIQNK